MVKEVAGVKVETGGLVELLALLEREVMEDPGDGDFSKIEPLKWLDMNMRNMTVAGPTAGVMEVTFGMTVQDYKKCCQGRQGVKGYLGKMA